jgi:hypothetical protein
VEEDCAVYWAGLEERNRKDPASWAPQALLIQLEEVDDVCEIGFTSYFSYLLEGFAQS